MHAVIIQSCTFNVMQCYMQQTFTDDTVLHKEVLSLQDAQGDLLRLFARIGESICGYSSTSPYKCHVLKLNCTKHL